MNIKFKILIPLIFCFCAMVSHGQGKIHKPVEQLLGNAETGKQRLTQMVSTARNKVELLTPNPQKAKEELFKCQVTAGSAIGSVIYHSGGILINGGWIRILGSGSPKLKRSFDSWNRGRTITSSNTPPKILMIADDAIGGIFAMNGGGLGADIGNIYYFPPDDLKWEPLEMRYSAFLEFCFSGDIETFYKGSKWTGWQKALQGLGTDEVFSFDPPLWSKEGENIEKVSKKKGPIASRYAEIAQYFK